MTVDIHASPYVGPRPFERRHTDIFYGRSREASELLDFVSSNQVVLVYAQSGVGKTSLLNAGLIPLLERDDFEIFPPARVRGLIPDHIAYESVSNPYILNTIISWETTDTNPATLLDKSISQFLRERPHQKDPNGFELPRVAIFDQFEELFSFYPDRWQQREEFFKQLKDTLEQDDLFRVVFVMREDFIAQVDPYADIFPGRLRARFRLEAMTPASALAAVVTPIGGTRRSFAPGAAEKLVEELTKLRIETQEGKTRVVLGEFVEPVQLQVVCQNLWQQLPHDVEIIDLEHIEAFGDIDQALSEFYQDCLAIALQATTVDEEALRRWFDEILITPAGTRGTVYQGKNTTGGIPNTAVKVLEDQHIIRAELRAGGRWYELTHDRFIEPIQKANTEWGIKKSEQEQEAKQQAIRQHYRGRLLSILAGVMAVFLAISLGLTIFAFDQRGKAEDQARIAETQAAIALNNAIVATQAQGQALSEANNAATQAANAQNNAATSDSNAATAVSARQTATQAQGQALSEANNAATQAANAQNNAATSDANAATAVSAQQTAAYAEQEANDVAEERRGLSISSFSLVALEQNDPELALALAWEAYQILPDSPQVFSNLSQITYSPFTRLHEIIQSDFNVVDAVFSDDSQSVFYATIEGRILQWDVASNALIREFDDNFSEIQHIALSHDNELLAAVGESGLAVWEVDTGERVFRSNGRFLSVAFNPVEPLIAFGDKDGEIILWNYDTEEIEDMRERQEGWVTGLEFSPDGSRLASGSCACEAGAGAELLLWDVDSRRVLAQVDPSDIFSIEVDAKAVAFHPYYPYLITGSHNGIAVVWQIVETDNRSVDIEYASAVALQGMGNITDIAFTPDGGRLYLGRSVPAINIASFQQLSASQQPIITTIGVLTGHQEGVNNIDISADGNLILSASNDNTIRVWLARDASERLSISIDCGCPINSLDLSNDGHSVVIGTHGRDMQLWDLFEHSLIRPFRRNTELKIVAYSPEESAIVSVDAEGEVVIWQASRDSEFELPESDSRGTATSAIFLDERHVFVGYDDGRILLWNISLRDQVMEFVGHEGAITSLEVNRDFNRVLSASVDGTARVWDIATGQEVRLFAENGGMIIDAAFNHDTSQIITAHEFGFINLWDFETGQVGQSFYSTAVNTIITTVIFHPNEQYILSGSSDGKIRLWDIHSGEVIRSFDGHRARVTDVEFFSEGNSMISSSLDRTLRVWQIDLSEQEVIPWIESNLYIRELTCEERVEYNVTPLCSD